MPNNLLRAALILVFLLTTAPSLFSQKQTNQIEDLQNFPDCFSIIGSDSLSLEKIKKLIADPPCFRQCLITNQGTYLLLLLFPETFEEQLHQCYYAQNNIVGAMKMYNSENLLPLRRINSDIVNKPETPLIPNYLKFPFPRPTKDCKFESTGDITRGNFQIFCTFHGAAGKKIKQ